MKIDKENVLNVFKRIVVRPTPFGEGFGFAMTFDGEPRTDEEDYVVVPKCFDDEVNPRPIEDAWKTLCAAAEDTKLPMLLSSTHLDIDCDFICVMPFYAGEYGLMVIPQATIPPKKVPTPHPLREGYKYDMMGNEVKDPNRPVRYNMMGQEV